MITFPNAKINLGLRITGRRDDGYHLLTTAMVPVQWCDILEIVPTQSPEGITFTQTGMELADCPPERNLVLKAIRRTEEYIGRTLPPMDIHLHKVIPNGAGLGGGSSDASSAIKMVNSIFDLGLDSAAMCAIALKVGADCPFFIYNRPMMATGIGEILEPIDIPALKGRYIAIVKGHDESVSTAEAYAGVCITPGISKDDLKSALAEPIDKWQGAIPLSGTCSSGLPLISNDFEATVGLLRPGIPAKIAQMYETGADYAAMTGSGAAVFGIFTTGSAATVAISAFPDCDTFVGAL